MAHKDEIAVLTAEINAFALSRCWLPANESEEIWSSWKRLRKTSTSTSSVSVSVSASASASVSDRDAELLPIWEQCESILKGILQNKYAYVFSKPVDPIRDGVPNYFEVVKRPMDLGTVKQRLSIMTRRRKEPLQHSMYKYPLEMKSDVEQVWVNCFLYNPPEYEVRKMGEILKSDFERRWKAMKIDETVQRINKQFPESIPTPADDIAMHRDPFLFNQEQKDKDSQVHTSVIPQKKCEKKRKSGFMEKERKPHLPPSTSSVMTTKELGESKTKVKKEEGYDHHTTTSNDPLPTTHKKVHEDVTKASHSSSAAKKRKSSLTKKMVHTGNGNLKNEGGSGSSSGGGGNNRLKDNVSSRKDVEKKGTQSSKNGNKSVEENKMRKLIQSCKQPMTIQKSTSHQTQEAPVPKREWLPAIERGRGASISKATKISNPKPQQVPPPPPLPPSISSSSSKFGKQNVWKKALSLHLELQKSMKGLGNKSESEMTDFEARRRLSILLESVTINALNLLISNVLSKDPSFANGESNLDLIDIKYIRRALRSIQGATTASKRAKPVTSVGTKQNSPPVKEDHHSQNSQLGRKRKKAEDDGTLLATKTPRVSPPSPPWDRVLTHNRTIWENAVDICGITPQLNGPVLGLTPRQESNGSTWEEAIPDDVEEGEIRN